MNKKPAANPSSTPSEKLSVGLTTDEQNSETLEQLVRALDYADGFAIFIARCNVPVQRRQFIAEAKAKLATLNIQVLELTFDQPIRDLRSHLRQLLADNQQFPNQQSPNLPISQSQELALAEPNPAYRTTPTPVIFISGLEFSIPFDDPSAPMLAELNLGRELFRRDAPCPLLFWLPDYAITSVARYAPDFWAWRSSVFEFDSDETLRAEAVHSNAIQDSNWLPISNSTKDEKIRRVRLLESLLDDYSNFNDDLKIKDEKSTLLFSLGQAYAELAEYDKALRSYDAALILCRDIGETLGEAAVLGNIGGVYDALGAKYTALDYVEQSLAIYRKFRNARGEAASLQRIGSIYAELGHKDTAMDYYEKALKLARKERNTHLEAATLNQIGHIYSQLSNYDRAVSYHEHSLRLEKELDDKGGMAMVMNNLGLVYVSQHNEAKALKYYNEALALHREIGNLDGEALLLNNIGVAYEALGDRNKALELYARALEIRLAIGDKWGESVVRYNMGIAYERIGDFRSAVEQLEQCVVLDEVINHPDLERDRMALNLAKRKLQTLERNESSI